MGHRVPRTVKMVGPPKAFAFKNLKDWWGLPPLQNEW